MRFKDKDKGKQRRDKAYNHLIEKGVAPHLAAGIVGNLMQESHDYLDSTVENEIGAFGIAQWLGPRKKSLFEFAKARGTKPTNFDTQLDFLYKELTSIGDSWTSKADKDAFFNAKTVDEAAALFVKRFERSGEKPGDEGYDNRLKNAKRIYLEYNDKAIYGKDENGNIVNINPEVATQEQIEMSPTIKDEFYKENFDLVAEMDKNEPNEPPTPIKKAEEDAEKAKEEQKQMKQFMERLGKSQQEMQKQAQERAKLPKQQAPKPINPRELTPNQNEFFGSFIPKGL